MNKQEPIIITKVSNGYYIKPLSSVFGDGMGGDQDIDVEMMIFRNIDEINAWMIEHFKEEEPIPAYDYNMDMDMNMNMDIDTNKSEATVLDLYGFVICIRCGKAYMGDDIESCCPECKEAINPTNVKPIEDDIKQAVQDEIQSEVRYPFDEEAKDDE